MSRLSQSQIQKHLAPTLFSHPIELHVLQSVDSTNQFLKELPKRSTPTFCCAEEQTNGRGRFGRSWYSPAFENIYFSARIPCNKPVSQLSGIGIVTAIAIINTLQDVTGIPFSIKWPNDILWKENKISGCLIELIRVEKHTTDLIIGIGINVNSNHQHLEADPKPITSLFKITERQYDRNRIIGVLLNQLLEHLPQFFANGLACFQERFKECDGLFGKAITVSELSGTQSGIANGIDKNGHLLLIDKKGIQHTLFSGTTTFALSWKKQ